MNCFCRLFYIFILTVACMLPANAQETFRVMCYNVENLFDTKHDTLKNDQEFLPGNMRGWNYKRYERKLANISRVVAAVSAWQWFPPAIIGLCEIENRHVLDDLTLFAPLGNFHYKIIHYESPDRRGVDVALLYQENRFRPIDTRPIRVTFPDNPARTTRDILYASGRLENGDTLHLFLTHFPSRLGGETLSEPSRIHAAKIIRHAVDSIQAASSGTGILIMGDFNDYPDNISIRQTLNALPLPETGDTISENVLYNLCFRLHQQGRGSYKHDGEWGMLDQIIVSGSLLRPSAGTRVMPQTLTVFSPEWLLEEDVPTGQRPFRTYIGMTYHGGFSDHLPLFIDLQVSD